MAFEGGTALYRLRPLSDTVSLPPYKTFKERVMSKFATAWNSGAEQPIQDAFEGLLFPLSPYAQNSVLIRGGKKALPEWLKHSASGGFHQGGYEPFMYKTPSLKTKKPDAVRYDVGNRGELCMVMAGEYKPKKGEQSRASTGALKSVATSFSNADLYEECEYLEILMDHQPDRAFAYGFLSSGYSTIMAKVERVGNEYSYSFSAEFVGENAVLAVLCIMMMDPEVLGFARLDLSKYPGRIVSRTLSVTSKTIVLETQQGETGQVMKLYRSGDFRSAECRRDEEVRMTEAARTSVSAVADPDRRSALLSSLPMVLDNGFVVYDKTVRLPCITLDRVCTPIQELCT